MKRKGLIGVLVVSMGTVMLTGSGYGAIVLPSGLSYDAMGSDWSAPASWLGAGNYYINNGEYPTNTSASLVLDLGSVQTVQSFNWVNTQANLGWWNLKELKVYHSIGEDSGTFVRLSSASYDTAEPIFNGIPGGFYNPEIPGEVRSVPLTSPTTGRYFMFELLSNGTAPYYLEKADSVYFGDIQMVPVPEPVSICFLAGLLGIRFVCPRLKK